MTRVGRRPGARVLAPGRNCWRIATAPRASVLIDAAAYFDALADALRQAERSIVIVGWDFDASIKLRPVSDETALGTLLRQLVEERPQLEVHILVWSVATLHAPGATLPLLLGAKWSEHPRIHLRLDTHHPLYAAHHQKIVCIDEALAFNGGMDLTVRRWDRPEHPRVCAARKSDDGEAYGPVHDIQMMVSGDAARGLRNVAAARWRAATGEELPAVSGTPALWPRRHAADFRNIEIAIARTAPRWHGQKPIEEISRLTLDLLAATQRTIYIEAQYLCAADVADVLERLLQRPDPPEIVAVAAGASHGLLERFVMGSNRDRMIRRLRRVDRDDRLRVYCPCGHDEDGCYEILVHSKLIIVDDTLLRIGSSNLSNRSFGLDTECDLTIEGSDAETRDAIAVVRARLLAEHLGSDPARVEREIAEQGSLIRAIERLNGGARRLVPFDALHERKGPTTPIFGTRLLDPSKPFRFSLPWRGAA